MSMTESERLTQREDDELYSIYLRKALIERLADYEDIGTVSEFRELKEKATAKMVWLYVGSDIKCPSCGMRLRNYEGVRKPYCKFCGQQLER